MNRRQLAFLITINALISLAIALSVAWVIEARRPDPEELAALATPPTNGAVTIADNNPAPVGETPVESAPPPAEATSSTPATPPPASEPVTDTQPAATPGEGEVYVVQAGDSLGAIASQFGVTVAAIVEANGLDNPDNIFSGQRLVIPVAGSAAPTTAAATPTTSPLASTGQGIRVGTVETPGNLLSEAVSIINDSSLAVNLQGWRLEREGGPSYTFGGVTLFPGGSLWLHTREGTNTTVALYWSQTSPVWQSGATVRLINPEGNAVSTYPVP
jgi:LysM repeat protein